MNDDLLKAKDRVKRLFLGKAGVHGVGVRETENAVTVYVDAQPIPSEAAAAMQEAAAPFALKVVGQSRAVAGSEPPPPK